MALLRDLEQTVGDIDGIAGRRDVLMIGGAKAGEHHRPEMRAEARPEAIAGNGRQIGDPMRQAVVEPCDGAERARSIVRFRRRQPENDHGTVAHVIDDDALLRRRRLLDARVQRRQQLLRPGRPQRFGDAGELREIDEDDAGLLCDGRRQEPRIAGKPRHETRGMKATQSLAFGAKASRGALLDGEPRDAISRDDRQRRRRRKRKTQPIAAQKGEMDRRRPKCEGNERERRPQRDAPHRQQQNHGDRQGDRSRRIDAPRDVVPDQGIGGEQVADAGRQDVDTGHQAIKGRGEAVARRHRGQAEHDDLPAHLLGIEVAVERARALIVLRLPRGP